jgi:hypothetical protein
MDIYGNSLKNSFNPIFHLNCVIGIRLAICNILIIVIIFWRTLEINCWVKYLRKAITETHLAVKLIMAS